MQRACMVGVGRLMDAIKQAINTPQHLQPMSAQRKHCAGKPRAQGHKRSRHLHQRSSRSARSPGRITHVLGHALLRRST